MTTAERHDRIVQTLATQTVLSLRDAIRLTGASEPTIRRDFVALADAGVLRRVRGGVRAVDSAGMAPFALREMTFSDEKQRVARRACALLRSGDVVFVDGGTTTFHLSTCLPAVPLRVITNSIRLADALDEQSRRHAGLEIFLTGGFVHPGSGLLVGPGAVASITAYRANWAFLSVGGLTVEGLSNTNEQVVESERRMIEHAARVAVLADHSKLARHAMCHVCPLDQIDVLVTDQAVIDERLTEALTAARVDTVVAT
jgi:DeoR/GlpR family transcriptional regulator of sugar metabolism